MKANLAILITGVLLIGGLVVIVALKHGDQTVAADPKAAASGATRMLGDVPTKAKTASEHDCGKDVRPILETYCFDNIGNVLSISPVLVEKSLAAAEKVSVHELKLQLGPGEVELGGEFINATSYP